MKAISGTDWGACAKTLRTTYISFIRPVLDYASPVFAGASLSNLEKLDRVQHNASRIITGTVRSCPTSISQYEADCLPLRLRRQKLASDMYWRMHCVPSQHCLSQLLEAWNPHTRLKNKSTPMHFLRTAADEIFSGTFQPIKLLHPTKVSLPEDTCLISDELQQHDKRDNPHLMHALNLT